MATPAVKVARQLSKARSTPLPVPPLLRPFSTSRQRRRLGAPRGLAGPHPPRLEGPSKRIEALVSPRRDYARPVEHEHEDPVTPQSLYEERVRNGILRDDAHQRKIVKVLQRMWDELAAYHPPDVPEPKVEKPGLFDKLRGKKKTTDIPPIPDNVPKGLYLYGSVGTGKSMLMDLFYDSLPERTGLTSRRVHFHQFMIDVHKKNHALSTKHGPQADVIVPIAREVARDSRILCFDEFQVTDIVDAMILKRLLETMIAYGVVCILTSNRHPTELYKNGIQRSSFLPCIDLIQERFVVQDLNSGTDYRRVPRAVARVYYHPVNRETRNEVDKLFAAMTDEEEVVHGRELTIWGRKLAIPESTSKVAKFTFDQLCGKPLSAADYLEITKDFETVFITEVPTLTFHQRDMARRFILFIDAAYESKTKLFTLSDPPIAQIFSDKTDKTAAQTMSPDMRAAMDDLGLDAAQIGASSIFSGEEETFAWARAVSRLTEMGTKSWAEGAKAKDDLRSPERNEMMLDQGLM